MQAQILAPAAALVLWTLVMLGWLGARRMPAIGGIKALGDKTPGARGADLEGVLPPQVNWPSHNYTHLTEQPTLFYATVAILAILGADRIDVAFAWGYVALRVVHSIWQSTVNRLPVRFALFNLSSGCLLVLAIRAALECFGR